MRKRTLSLALAVTAVAATALTGASAGTAGTAATPDPLHWGPCTKKAGAAPRLQCATLKVPLDYREPDGRTIKIAVSRLASKKPSQRRGVLLTNPGGPGVPGLGYPAVLASSGLPQDVLDSYDLIGFDPRGAGRSAPVTCDLTERQQQRGNFPPYAHTGADVTREAAYARTVARQCAGSRSAWMLPHTTTANTARDMDRIRAALGESRISYLGASYGTQLGAVYATLFPRRGDRIVLDSSLGPGGYDVTAFRMLARGMEERFPDFAEFAARHPGYGLGTTPGQVKATYDRLVEKLDAEPVHGVDGTAFRGITFEHLYSDAGLPTLAKGWQALGRGEPMPSEPPAGDVENSLADRHYVLCADSRWPRKIRDYQRAAAVDRFRYPMLGGTTGSITPCAYWPRKGIEPPVRIGDRGPSTMLMVQNERDPGTPLAGARKLRRALGERVRMVTADQGGHGVYPFNANTCANDATTKFLTTGKRPARDVSCPAGTDK
ncbi:alpha/beta hydrolase [Streptomyces nanshensis]|uniref:Hydrolase n=1 Tax=Streptomyces nanshensis TaxID=518642 RepID=A0A1E7L9G6_9ACTN|nr:alpha/beta hydrolase [Streptomyces nanshensis]OEV12804.1 hydrolase [Streptomyces nanshensis]